MQSAATRITPSTSEAPAKAAKRRSPWPLRLAAGHLLLVCVLGGAARLFAERFWWSTLLLYLPQVVFAAPAVVTLPVALRKTDGRALLAALAALAVVAGPMMGFNLPSSAPMPSASLPRVRLLEYNIQGGIAGWYLIRRQVEQFRPDVVIFAEARGWGLDQRIQRGLEEVLPGWSHGTGGDVFVASRWPIVEEAAAPLGISEERKKVRVVVEAPFGRFNVIGVHFWTAVHGETLVHHRGRVPDYLHRTGQVRLTQARDLIRWTKTLEGPLLLAGDLNTPPAGRIYDALTERFGDSFAERGKGWGFTYPARLPLLRIDYIFHSPEWAVTECRVGGAPGSDHRPLFAELALRQ
jgi:vancomycin resistance protein VanJ